MTDAEGTEYALGRIAQSEQLMSPFRAMEHFVRADCLIRFDSDDKTTKWNSPPLWPGLVGGHWILELYGSDRHPYDARITIPSPLVTSAMPGPS